MFDFIYLSVLCFVLCSSKNVPTSSTLMLNEISDCDVPKSPLRNGLFADMNIVKDKQNRYIEGNFSLPYEVDDSFTYKMVLNKWENTWVDSGIHSSGNLCDTLRTNLPNLWKKFSEVSKPKIPLACPIEAGYYVVKKIILSKSDISYSAETPGKYLLQFIVSKDSIPILCKLFDIQGIK